MAESQPAALRPSVATRAPSIGSSTTATISRMPAGQDAAPTPAPGTDATEMDIDWIAEQVGHRLARRLEVDRERMGVRQWRQLS